MDRSDSIVFKPALDDVLLEICVEPEDFSVILEPWGLNSWDIVILRAFPSFLEGEIADRFCHLIDQILVNIFPDELPLFLLGAVDQIELLSFVEVFLVGVVEDMSWQERHLLRNIGLHVKLYFYYLLSKPPFVV